MSKRCVCSEIRVMIGRDQRHNLGSFGCPNKVTDAEL